MTATDGSREVWVQEGSNDDNESDVELLENS